MSITTSIVERPLGEAVFETLKKFMSRPEVVVMTRRTPVGVQKLAKVASCHPRMTVLEGVYGFEHLRHALPDDESRLRLSCACGGFVISRLHVDAPWEVVSDGNSFA